MTRIDFRGNSHAVNYGGKKILVGISPNGTFFIAHLWRIDNLDLSRINSLKFAENMWEFVDSTI